MSEIEKVAVLLIALGPQKAQRILDRLGPDELMPIVQAMRKLKKITPEVREQVLREVNGILEDLAASAFPGSEFDPAPPGPDVAPPERPASPSAREILEQVQDVLPDRVEPENTPPTRGDASPPQEELPPAEPQDTPLAKPEEAPRAEPEDAPRAEIDWGAAGFDFGSGNRAKRDDEEDDTPPERGRSR